MELSFQVSVTNPQWRLPAGGGAPSDGGDSLLLEIGDHLLLETNDNLLLEAA